MHSQLALSVNAALVHLTPDAGNKQQNANKRNFRHDHKGQNLSSQLNRREWQAGNFLRPACLPLKGYGDANAASVENVDNHACLVLLCVVFSNGPKRCWTLLFHEYRSGNYSHSAGANESSIVWVTPEGQKNDPRMIFSLSVFISEGQHENSSHIFCLSNLIFCPLKPWFSNWDPNMDSGGHCFVPFNKI